jgi:hypothetical protein
LNKKRDNYGIQSYGRGGKGKGKGDYKKIKSEKINSDKQRRQEGNK